MRTTRSVLAPLAVVALVTACEESATESPAYTGPPPPSFMPGGDGGASASPAGGEGGSGGPSTGTLTYDISGDATASGEIEFDPSQSEFSGTGWAGIFQDTDTSVAAQVFTVPGSLAVNWSSPTMAISATEAGGCVFAQTQNDANGLVGSVDCGDLPAAAGGTIHFQAVWDAHS